MSENIKREFCNSHQREAPCKDCEIEIVGAALYKWRDNSNQWLGLTDKERSHFINEANFVVTSLRENGILPTAVEEVTADKKTYPRPPKVENLEAGVQMIRIIARALRDEALTITNRDEKLGYLKVYAHIENIITQTDDQIDALKADKSDAK